MYSHKTFLIEDRFFKPKLLQWANQFSHVCFLDSQNYRSSEKDSYDLLVGAGCMHELKSAGNSFNDLKIFYDTYCKKGNDWLFGYFTYDLKNDIEPRLIGAENYDGIQFPAINFFTPEFVFELNDNTLRISINEKSKKQPDQILAEILQQEIPGEHKEYAAIKLSARISQKKYFETFEKILQHIQRGDVYELNYCQEFYAEKTSIDPAYIFTMLCQISPVPFSCFYKLWDHYLLCASPERFLKKQGNRVISQPIKGTIKRGKNEAEDLLLKSKLQQDEKERSENVMIVDLVRNDLSRIAARGSVKVEELFGIYSFSQVHQMISTVSCDAKTKVHPVDIIKAGFPMGSMTGAPKIKAMELIEKYESVKRGLFSGAAGYFSPAGNFDFNVVIRSILYNAMNHYLSVMVGGAITAKANAEDEYNECLLKASAMMQVLSGKTKYVRTI
ncbi:MAG TPA: anthranilate synthase component I family protein [Bacteroidia bacterium]|nr:anthranilate synthase component I family protein [Bacteroidia bacterium]